MPHQNSHTRAVNTRLHAVFAGAGGVLAFALSAALCLQPAPALAQAARAGDGDAATRAAAPRPSFNPKSSIQLLGTIRSYKGSSPRDIQDPHIYSPKSALFTPDGTKLYINALEGFETIVYDFPALTRRKVIRHTFDAANSQLFKGGESSIFDYKFYAKNKGGALNHFSGKPVESVLTHNGRFLWVTYYRRSYDANATSPSAIAIIDTSTDEIVRVMPTGPLPKVVTASPDGATLAVVHWGDNSIALMDIRSDNPQDFRYTKLLELNRPKNLANIAGNRDRICGECLRGAVFTPDSKYLFVARMGGGAIAVFDVPDGRYLGSIVKVAPSPRHLDMTKDGSLLYVTSNRSGIVTRFSVPEVLADILRRGGDTPLRGQEIFVGNGARTFALSPDERHLYVVSNLGLKVSKIDTQSWRIVDSNGAYAYPVGLAVSPDGRHLVTTSQGREGRGGNTVGIYQLQ